MKMNNVSRPNDIQDKQVTRSAPIQTLQGDFSGIVQSDNPTNISPQPNPTANPSQDTIYEGFTFFQADPIPGEQATWYLAERTQMYMPQHELSKMVQKRAEKLSAAQQYQRLREIPRLHINQIIYEKRCASPQMEWSCAYAKKRVRRSKPDSTNIYKKRVSIRVVLLQRPPKTMPYPRTPMGDLVDLHTASRLNSIEYQRNSFHRTEMTGQQRTPPLFQSRSSPSMQTQVPRSGNVIQRSDARPASVTTSFAGLGPCQEDTLESLESKTNGTHARLAHPRWLRPNGSALSPTHSNILSRFNHCIAHAEKPFIPTVSMAGHHKRAVATMTIPQSLIVPPREVLHAKPTRLSQSPTIPIAWTVTAKTHR